MKYVALILLSFLFMLLPVSAQPDVTPPKSDTVSEATKIDPSKDAQVVILNAELQVYKGFMEHLLDTVYFSLGTVVVVLFAMVGFGWYQNVRAYERDKDALMQSLSIALTEKMAAAAADLDKKATERFLAFDRRMAEALEHTYQQLRDLHLASATSIFSRTHAGKTPRTDLIQLLTHVQSAIGKVSTDTLNEALSAMIEHLESCERIDSRTSWLALVERLPSESSGHAARLREILATKAS
jgi:hypothetical protein